MPSQTTRGTRIRRPHSAGPCCHGSKYNKLPLQRQNDVLTKTMVAAKAQPWLRAKNIGSTLSIQHGTIFRKPDNNWNAADP